MTSGFNGIDIRIVEEDGLSYPADALVLKHAQALYGLDALVVARAAVPSASLPSPDGFRIFRDPDGIGAKALLFIGVRPISEFTYSDVRLFGFKALCAAASAVPQAQEIGLTLHGVGYGLDEVECFDAEIAGILDAIESRDFPHGLRIVSFLEINRGRAARLRNRLAHLEASASFGEPNAQAEAQTVPAPRSAGIGQERSRAFVAMPFDESFTDLFHYGISSAVRANGLLCERIDQLAFTGDILQRLKDRIRAAKLVVADLTGSNANVFLEVGYAWGTGVPTILICEEGSPLKFDVQGQRCLFYASIRDLESKLGPELEAILASRR